MFRTYDNTQGNRIAIQPEKQVLGGINLKELTIKNIQTVTGEKLGQNGNEFTVKPVVSGDEATKCRVNFVEVEPGNFAFGFHYHECEEEVFYIISGTGAVRTAKGEQTVRAGEVIAFPAGPDGAHVIRNGSNSEKLVYIDFGTCCLPEIVHFPDINKIMVNGPYSSGTYDL